jgi:hypothetical protein
LLLHAEGWRPRDRCAIGTEAPLETAWNRVFLKMSWFLNTSISIKEY